MRVFSVPVSVPFLRTVIAALVDGRLVEGFEARKDPLNLATATLYLPTRRASNPSTSRPSTSAAMTVRRKGTDTGTLKTRMGFLIRGQAQYREVLREGHGWGSGVPVTHCNPSW